MPLVAGDLAEAPIHISEDCTITKVVVLGRGGPGSCVLDIWKSAFASYPPTVANSICASAKPTISADHKYSDIVLTGWTTALSRGDTLLVKVESVSTFTALGVFLELTPVGAVDTDGYTDERVREIIAEEGAAGDVTVINTGANFSVSLGGGIHQDLDIFALCGEPSGAGTITVVIPTGVIVQSTSRARPAMDLSGFASGSTVNLTNQGYVLGRGGDGGDGASIVWWADGDASGAKDPSAGKDGGPAIKGPGSGITFFITNVAGRIWGGGGGGSGAGVSVSQATGAIGNGGGGGGGAGGGKGGRGSIARRSHAAGGGTSAPGTDGGEGTSGPNGVLGSGGPGAESGSGEGGDGGAGGDWGAAGSAGTSPTAFAHDIAAAAAGAAGKAVNLNGGSVTFISGSGSPNVKGAVS